MKTKILFLMAMVAVLSSCGKGPDATIISRSANEITDEYLANLESRNKTLLTLNVLDVDSVTLFVRVDDNTDSAGCSSTSICYFEYDADVDAATVSSSAIVEWMGDCVENGVNACVINSGFQLSVTVTSD